MSNICLIGQAIAGGVITGPGSPKMTLGGVPISIVGDSIAPHGKSPHAAAVIVSGSSKLTVGGIAITVEGSPASCGHTASAGSGKFTVG